MIIKAYAKVNFILNVLGKRPDGFHEVETLMQAVDLYDTVEITRSDEPGEFPYGEKDLARRALELMKTACGRTESYRVNITKRIPAAAGLGGGSADAAAVITGLARIWGIEDLDRLLKIGAELGSDVPFCIAAQNGHTAAIGTGKGEKLEFVEPVGCFVNITTPPINIPDKTRSVYAELRPEDCVPVRDVRALIAAKTVEEKYALMGNHLQAPLERLTGIRAQGILCGAGPSFFTVSADGPGYRTVL